MSDERAVKAVDGHKSLDEQALDLMIARVLRGGIILAASLGIAGGIPYLIRHGMQPVAFHVFGATVASLRSPRAIFIGAVHFRSRWVIQLALLALIATPIARVGLSLVAFAKERDWTYVGISAFVLALLAFSLIAGHTI